MHARNLTISDTIQNKREIFPHCINGTLIISPLDHSPLSLLLSVPADVLSDLPRDEEAVSRVEDCHRGYLHLSGLHWPAGLVAGNLR